MMDWVWFYASVALGAILGFFVACLCWTAGDRS